MYLIKIENPGIHGVDYTKGLEDGRHCGVRHLYQTKCCRPILHTEEECWASEELRVDYDSLSDGEKLELGEPLFFGSPLFRALGGKTTRYLTEIAELDVRGQTIAHETRIREEYEDR